MVELESPASLRPTTATTIDGGAGGNGSAKSLFDRRPRIRVTTEYDSDSSVFFHKISCKLLDSLAKLKFSFQNDGKGEILEPQVAFTSKYLSLHYDIEENNALLKASFDVGPGLQFKAAHDVKVLMRVIDMCLEFCFFISLAVSASLVCHYAVSRICF